MKNVLLLVHDDEGQEARTQAALDLARTLEGHLTCLDIERIPEFANDYFTSVGGMNYGFEEHDRSVSNRTKLETRLADEDVPWDWVHEVGDVADLVSHSVDLSDIVVMNTDMKGSAIPEMRSAVSAAAFKAKKPILAVPKGYLRFSASGLAVVAWDGSHAAAAALRAATPILAYASAVHIVEIDKFQDGGTPAEEGAAYLSRHGIKAVVRHETTHGMTSISEKLIELAERAKVDYIVLGAYGHSRLTEAVFGGVTRSMLIRTPVPLILAH
jgi:nucleotide-binding universal stress UspA family protein